MAKKLHKSMVNGRVYYKSNLRRLIEFGTLYFIAFCTLGYFEFTYPGAGREDALFIMAAGWLCYGWFPIMRIIYQMMLPDNADDQTDD